MTQAWSELGATFNCPDDIDTANQSPDCIQWVMNDSSQWPFLAAPTHVILHQNGQLGVVEWDVTADVAAFLAGTAPNNGWIIKKADEGKSGHVQYSSREGASPPELVLTVGGPTPPPAVTIQDTYLLKGQPNKNKGSEVILRLKSSGNNRALVQFDQADIAAAVGSETLTSAKLRLTIVLNANNWGASGRDVAVHRMTRAWSEIGTTWNCSDDLNTQNSAPDCPGAEWEMTNNSLWPFEATPTAVALHQNQQSGVVEWDVTADVGAFLAGTATNNGWIVKKVEEGQSGKVEYSSREGVAPPELLLNVSGAASLDAVTPDTGTTGQSLAVTLTGTNTNFQQGATEASFGPNISVGVGPEGDFGPVTVQDSITATANIAISNTAALGPRNVTVRTNGEQVSKAEAFTVLAPGPVAIAETSVTTIAGSGTPGFVDGPGTAAQFDSPGGIARDAAGNLYVADTNNHRIRKIANDGTATTLAGTGTPGLVNGPVLSAQFDSPEGVAVDTGGTVYVADTANNVIRQIATDGTVTTLAGTGIAGFLDAPGSIAQFDRPRSIALRSDGIVIVGDEGNGRVRLVDPTTGNVSTLAGSGTRGFLDGAATVAQFASLSGVAVDPDGNVYVADTDNQRIRKIATDGTVSTFAGTGAFGFADGSALSAQFADPSGVAVDLAGNVFVADSFNSLIRRITPVGQVETVAGTGVRGADDGPGTSSTFRTPQALVTGIPGQVFITDTGNHKIRLVQIGPVITGLSPNSGVQGETPTVIVSGTNLGGATALTFLEAGVADLDITATGLSVDPTGTTLTASVTIAPTASIGTRIVTVTTPGGTSSDTATAANTFTVEGKITLTPALQTVRVNETGDVTVNLSGPADTGGVSVTLTSAAAGTATVTSPVDIPAGLTTGTATVTGKAAGTTNILATAPGYQSGTAAVEVVDNQPPVVDPIGDQTAPLGQTLSFTVTGSDPDGDPLTFGVTPLPLPPNMSFDSQVGLFTFTPDGDQVGTFSLTFLVSDGQDTTGANITITVPGAPAGGVTAFSGRVLDANDFENGITRPVVGATISFLGAGQSALTDADGFFTVSNLPAGRQVLDIDPATANPAPDGSTYAGFRERIELIANVTTVIDRPFFLPRIDAASLTTVNPNATTVVTNPNLGVTLTIPPNTAKAESGANFTGQLSISPVPRDLAPVELPEDLRPGLLVTIQPVGVTFSTPVPITFPNLDGLAPDTELNLWSLLPDEGTFAIVGTGQVSADGQRIETVDGGIRAADWHLFLALAGIASDQANNALNRSPKQCTVCQMASSVTVHDGGLMMDHTLPSIRSLGVSRSLRLVYSSPTADVRPIVPLDVSLRRRTAGVPVAVPRTLSATLTVGGVAQEDAVFFDTSGLPGDANSQLRLPLQFDGSTLPTGRYPYRARIFSNFVDSSFGSTAGGQVLIVNQRQGPLGAGWDVAGLQRLHFSSAGTIVLTEGDGSALVFGSGVAALTGQTFNTPRGLTVAPDGTIFLSEDPGGTASDRILRIAPNGTISTFTDQGISNPADLAVDAGGTLYLSNSGNSLLFRFLNADPNQQQVFASFASILQPLGLALDQAQNLYVVNNSGTTLFPDDTITRLFPGGIATVPFAEITDPIDIAINDRDEIFVTSRADGTVYRVTQQGDIFPFVQGLSQPFGLAVDAERNLYVMEAGERTILKVTPDGVREIVATDVPTAFFLEIDNDGNLLVPDSNSRVLRVQLQPSTSETFTSPPGDFSRLVKNVDGSFTRTLKDGTRIEFDAQGLQTAMVDRNGNTTSYTYDPDGRLTSITDPVGQVTTLAYDGNSLLLSIADPANRVTTFAHDTQGNLTQITNPDGTTVRYSYNTQHHLIKETDERGNVTTYTYDFAGRLFSVTQPTDEVRQVRPSETDGLVDVASGQGTAGTPAPITRPEDVEAGITDGKGNGTNFTVNRFGAILTQTDALGRVTEIVRDANNLPTQITRPNGSVVNMTYDADGNLLTTTEQAIGATTTFTYESTFNQVTSITDPEGNATTITYDANGNPTQIKDALNNTTTLAYDLRGLLTSVTDALGNVTNFAYDLKGNLTSTTDALGNTTSLSYDAAGNVTTSTDALGRVTQFAYDPTNRLTQVTDAAGGITQYAYNPSGNLLSVTDAKNQTTSFAYDAVDQLIQTTNTLGQSKTFSYDLARNLLLVVDAKGQRIEFTYDAANQLVQKILKDTVGTITDTVSFTYDSLGNLATANDSDSGLTFTYDALSRLTQAQTAPTVAQPATSISYTYDNNGNRLSMSDPQGGVTNYVYDAVNRLASLTSPQGTPTFTYDALSRRTALNLPNGGQASYTYDAASQLTELLNTVGATTISRFDYTYNAVGNRITRTTTDGIANYDYDALNRLFNATQPDPVDPLQQLTETFTYDSVGNRTNSHLATGQVHDASNRLLEDSNFTFSYDANGNLTTKTNKATAEVTTYTYDTEDRLIRVDKPGVVAEYRYDALGRRVEKVVNGVSTRYIYDNEDILLELDGANQVVARYTHGPGIDEPLIMARGGQSFFYHPDGLGSIWDLTDASGSAARSYTYDSFGQLIAQTGTVTNPYTYTAREFDPETGLYYYRARYYDPTTGRFLQEDPLNLGSVQLPEGSFLPTIPKVRMPLLLSLSPQRQNLYIYAGDDPINNLDPDGLQWWRTILRQVLPKLINRALSPPKKLNLGEGDFVFDVAEQGFEACLERCRAAPTCPADTAGEEIFTCTKRCLDGYIEELDYIVRFFPE